MANPYFVAFDDPYFASSDNQAQLQSSLFQFELYLKTAKNALQKRSLL